MIQIVYQVIYVCKSLMLNDCDNFAHHLHTKAHVYWLDCGLLMGCGREQKAGGEGVNRS